MATTIMLAIIIFPLIFTPLLLLNCVFQKRKKKNKLGRGRKIGRRKNSLRSQKRWSRGRHTRGECPRRHHQRKKMVRREEQQWQQQQMPDDQDQFNPVSSAVGASREDACSSATASQTAPTTSNSEDVSVDGKYQQQQQPNPNNNLEQQQFWPNASNEWSERSDMSTLVDQSLMARLKGGQQNGITSVSQYFLPR